jgi:hypothetical protein
MEDEYVISQARYHESVDQYLVGQRKWVGWTVDHYAYQFENFFHPFVGRLISQLNQASGDPIEALCDPDFLDGLTTAFFDTEYTVDSRLVSVTSFPKAIDLDHELPYANYNWELLYHLPVAVAVHLSQAQRFAEAQKWFHYLFDPSAKDGQVWRFLYFRKAPPSLDLASLLALLSNPNASGDPNVARQKQDILTSYDVSLTSPFSPFAAARPRSVSFQYYVVMKYLDNLIAWGDSLFAQMTIETVNEATLCYVLAANLLGPKPQQVPPAGSQRAQSYRDLKKSGLDKLGDALVHLEGQFPFNITTSSGGGEQAGPLFGMGRSLYFCVPPNSKLLGYWDTVEDRLSKIRNCENIHGQVQLMPLFDPPINPGMLVKAAAAGLDLGSVVSGLNQPVSPVRTPMLIQKALELTSEVRGLGAGLLAALEKGDAEQLALLRQNHEGALLSLQQNIRFLHWNQAKAATDALLRSRDSAYERYTFYLRMLGQAADQSTAPPTFDIDRGTVLSEENFDDAYQELVGKYDKDIVVPAYPPLKLAQSSSPSAQSGASGTGNLYLTPNEDDELNDKMPAARDLRDETGVLDSMAARVVLIPSFYADLHFWGMGAHTKVFGGDTLADVYHTVADGLRTAATYNTDQGAIAARTAGYQRRADDWQLQANLAARELRQIGRQLLASLVAEQAARAEYETSRTQVTQNGEVLAFMTTKFTNAQLYGWLQGQLSGLYYQYYRMAVDLARKSEQTMKWELMRPEVDATSYVQPNYWDSGNQGLTSGDALALDIHRLETDYHDYNLRELELTRHVSLRQLDPLALLALKVTGRCTLTIPEWLYDRDCPGHYFRRIKSVSVSIPSVVGPYTSVNCTLTMQHSSVRVSPIAGTTYERNLSKDDVRFVDYYGSVQSIVTSGAVNDSGMFETNLRDERFLPFEGAGAISTWTLQLPHFHAFDYSTITDVVLHVRYTARDAGAALGTPAITALKHMPPADPTPGAPTPALALLISLRHDFPTEWHAFASGGAGFSAELSINHFPYIVHDTTLTLTSVRLYGNNTGSLAQVTPPNLDAGTLANMGHDLKQFGAVTLALPADPEVLTPTSDDVYVIVMYESKRP